jgi:predicted methyltransferase
LTILRFFFVSDPKRTTPLEVHMKTALLFLALALSMNAGAQQVTDAPRPTAILSSEPKAVNDLNSAILGGWRSASNKARDQYRHPAQTLDFFGFTPHMTVVEITPGTGWYTEILAPTLKRSGKYIAALESDPDEEDKRDAQIWHTKVLADPLRYGATAIVEFDNHSPDFGAPGSADMVLTFRNVHNWESAGNANAMFRAFFDVLKPGGVLGVTDHRAKEGMDIQQSINSGYIPEEYVISLANEAGFVLAGKSEINANAKDTKDYAAGVWTLPPTLAMGKSERDRYLAIGESDRMTLKFVKPRQAK